MLGDQSELARILLQRHIGGESLDVLNRRPGSAPPQMDELPGSPVGNHDFTRLLLGQTHLLGTYSPSNSFSSAQAHEHDFPAPHLTSEDK